MLASWPCFLKLNYSILIGHEVCVSPPWISKSLQDFVCVIVENPQGNRVFLIIRIVIDKNEGAPERDHWFLSQESWRFAFVKFKSFIIVRMEWPVLKVLFCWPQAQVVVSHRTKGFSWQPRETAPRLQGPQFSSMSVSLTVHPSHDFCMINMDEYESWK